MLKGNYQRIKFLWHRTQVEKAMSSPFLLNFDNLSLISADFEQTVRLAELNPIKKVRSR